MTTEINRQAAEFISIIGVTIYGAAMALALIGAFYIAGLSLYLAVAG